MPLDPLLLYHIPHKRAAKAARYCALYIKHERASPSTTALIRRRNYAPLSLVAIRACPSPYAALRRSARLSRGCSSSRRENAETFASLLVPLELSRSSLIFTPREYKRTRAPHRRYSDCYAKRQSRHSSARAGFSVSTVRRLIMLVRDPNFFQKTESKFRILGGVKPFRTRGRKARRERGGILTHPRDEQLDRACLNTTNSRSGRRERDALALFFSEASDGVFFGGDAGGDEPCEHGEDDADADHHHDVPPFDLEQSADVQVVLHDEVDGHE